MTITIECSWKRNGNFIHEVIRHSKYVLFLLRRSDKDVEDDKEVTLKFYKTVLKPLLRDHEW